MWARQNNTRHGPAIAARLVRLLGAALVLGQIVAAQKDPQASVLLSEANALFREGNALVSSDPDAARECFRKAAMRFERMIRDKGIRNGRLYYNTGNAYFRMGDIGRAILYYRRAQGYIPDDPNLQQNLAYARATREDRFRDQESRRVLKTLLFFHYDLSRRTRVYTFALAFAACWLMLSVMLFSKRGVWRWLAGLAAGVALVTGASLGADLAARARTRAGVVVARDVVARTGDGEAYEPRFTEPLHAGTEFVLEEDRGEWLHVRLPDGTTCWLPAEAVGMVH